MRLPITPPLEPMLSSAADALPEGDGWLFEPKWDGFRTLVFRDGEEILLQSRDGKPMNRYFPELLGPLAAALPQRCVVDGEVVIVGNRGLDFEALLLRIHPAASRVQLLASQIPASFVAWDLLARGDEDLRDVALGVRRGRLGEVLASAREPGRAFPDAVRRQLVVELAPLRQDALADHPWRDWADAQADATAKGQRLPGASSRWNRGKDLNWEPLRPTRVCEVAYDHMQGSRFRHAAQFVRWRPALEARQGIVFVLRFGDGDKRLCRLAATAAFLCGARGLPSRRGDTRRLAGLLLVVGGPRRIPEAGGFLCSGQVEKLVE